ncbi:MAG: UV DNA damage repair endonuclease UvsE [Candidatus Sericytochromatia bacterium]|nr:UV DNA damage repair endonuclease UvsE [Candidatus Sericytochromatia bacterium]
MKIGYPCMNKTINCGVKTFRLASYSETRLMEDVKSNLESLQSMLKYNVKENMMFFRISSDLIPFASHPINQFNWREHFKKELTSIGDYIKTNNIRISMHPDQFVLINSLKDDVVTKSIGDLTWHCHFLDSMGLDKDAKVQIHVGGMYGDRDDAIRRFVNAYNLLPDLIKKRLVIENDDRLFTLKDCMQISDEVGIPIIFDNFHNECNNNGETNSEAIKIFSRSWKKEDGIPMVDYSSQAIGERKGKHNSHIDIEHFRRFLEETTGSDFDIILEIKDKEISAKEAIATANKLNRLVVK